MKKLLITSLSLFVWISCSGTDDGYLTKEAAAERATTIFNEATDQYTSSFASEWEAGVLTNREYEMPFWYAINGEKPANGYPMYISMHGGGGAPSEVNDKQWENQKKLYGIVEGIYWVPRAPTDTWDLWHQEYMDDFLVKAVTYAVKHLDADPNRIYIMGYSAGGDGTFNLAPRLADRFAGAAMMAGHPGDAEARNLRNLPFAIYMGGKDAAYNRNGLAAMWGEKLDSLQNDDPKGYIHTTHIYEEKGHWMDNLDKDALSWLPQFKRDQRPDRIIWVQDDVLANRKYNLEVENPKVGDEIIVSFSRDNNSVTVEKSDYKELTLWLNDEILDLDEPIKIIHKGEVILEGKLHRTEENIRESIDGRYDSRYIFPAKITVALL